MLPSKVRQDLIQRLRKIEGQAQGIQRMLAEERDCHEVLNQLASVRAATHRVSLELVRHYALGCLQNAEAGADPNQVLDEMIGFLLHVAD